MPSGDHNGQSTPGGFSPAQVERLTRACEGAEAQTGLVVTLGVGAGGSDLREEGERALARLLDGRALPALMLMVDPGARRLEILTSGPARRRLTDQQCRLAALSMTTSFGVGDLVGGIVNGIRMLADAAGSFVAPIDPEGLHPASPLGLPHAQA